jgi:hypothetical protein
VLQALRLFMELDFADTDVQDAIKARLQDRIEFLGRQCRIFNISGGQKQLFRKKADLPLEPVFNAARHHQLPLVELIPHLLPRIAAQPDIKKGTACN